jgi:hypothetical protein
MIISRKLLVGKPKGRYRHELEYSIKMDVIETGYKGVKLIWVVQDRVQGLVNFF